MSREQPRPGQKWTARMNHPLVNNARDTAIAMHIACGHRRSDDTPYWVHPQRVAETLAAHGQPSEVIAAAWLHDTAEDCPADRAGSIAMLARFAVDFGPSVAGIVAELTLYLPGASMEERQERIRERAAKMSDEAKWVKLADRLDNIADMEGWTTARKRRYAAATLLLLDALRPWPHGSEPIAARIAYHAAHARARR